MRVNGDEGIKIKLNTQIIEGENEAEKIEAEYPIENGVELTWQVNSNYDLVSVLVNGQEQLGIDGRKSNNQGKLQLNSETSFGTEKLIMVEFQTEVKKEDLPLEIIGIKNDAQNDWLEFFNPNREPIKLNRYCLADEIKNKCDWQLPDILLESGQTIRIFSEDNQTSEAWRNYYFNFNLKKDEIITLFDINEEKIVQKITVPRMTSEQVFVYNRRLDYFQLRSL